MPLVISRCTWVAILVFLLATACGDEGDGDAVGPTPRYAVSTNVFSADLAESTLFIGFVDNLNSGEVDLVDALEISGSGSLWGVDSTGEFYVTSSESVSIRKFAFERGRLTEIGRIGLGGVGVTMLVGAAMVFDGPDRGYLFDVSSGQALELDLRALEIVRSVDLSEWLDASQPTFLGYRFIERGNDELVGVTYATDFVQETVSTVSQILFFDVATGGFELRPSPCGGIQYGVQTANGDIFFASDPWVASVHAVDETRAPAPCLIRIPAGSRDPAAQTFDLSELTGAPTGGLIPSGSNSAFVRVLDTESYPLAPTSTGLELFGAPFWQTWEIDLSDPTQLRRVEREPELLPGGIAWLQVDGEFYENVSTTDFAATTLYRTTSASGPTPGLTVPGVPFNIVRLR